MNGADPDRVRQQLERWERDRQPRWTEDRTGNGGVIVTFAVVLVVEVAGVALIWWLTR